MDETPEMPRKRPSPKKRIFAWGINDTLKKRSRYDDENESLLIENGAELDKEEKKKDCDLISAVKSLDEEGVSSVREPSSTSQSSRTQNNNNKLHTAKIDRKEKMTLSRPQMKLSFQLYKRLYLPRVSNWERFVKQSYQERS